MKKHGIYIVENNKYNTKKIYDNGHLLVRYLFQPKQLKFKSKMVNDDNQHFSGGWSIANMDLSDEALLRRVANGLKPMAIIYKWKKEELEKYIMIAKYGGDLKQKRTNNKLIYQAFDWIKPDLKSFYLAVACKGVMKDLFDLKTLKEDYASNSIDIDISKVEDKTLKDYFKDWDAQDEESEIEYWETGLILGYPIENTISWYRNGIK